jgi:hypothetical protein
MSGAQRQRRYMARLRAGKPSADLAAAKREIARLKARIAELEDKAKRKFSER